MHRLFFAALLLGWLCLPTFAADLTAAAAAEITVDGKLDEAAWQAAPVASHFKPLNAREGKPPTADTSFRVLADDDAFYLGIRCEEPKMPELKANPVPRDGPVFSEDCVEMFFDPKGSGTEYYQYALSANNDQWDQYYIESGNTTIGPYSSFWESAVHRGADFWSVEVRIPYAALYLTPAAAFKSDWLLNVARERKPVYELSTWSALQGGFHEPARWNHVDGMRAKNPRYDLAVDKVQATVESVAGEAYTGRVTMLITATAATAGTYQLSLASDGQAMAGPMPVTLKAGDNTVTMPDVRFHRLGKQDLRLALTGADGQAMGGRYFPLRVEYEALAWDVTSPFYARCIFPDETVDAIAGTLTVNLPADRLADAKVTFTLTGPGLVQPVQQVVPLRQRQAAFSLPTAGMTFGESRVHAQVVAGAAELADSSLPIRKLAPNDGGSMLRIDRGLRLVVNGTPTFVRGWYGPHWMIGWAYEEKYPAPRDASPVVNQGKQVGMEAERISRTARGQAIHDVRPDDAIFAEMRKRIEANIHDPDFWWYYLCDEPECRQISPVYLKYQYDFIKEHDPYHPVMIITRAPEIYVDCADILNPHPYLNPHVDADGVRAMTSPTEIRDQVRTVLTAGDHRILPLLTPQSFTYGFINRFALFPTFDEYRCMMWTAVANGCRGFTPFTYGGSRKTWQLRYGSDFVYESMAALNDFLVQPGDPRPVTVTAPDNGVDVMLRQLADGRLLLVAVNLLDRPVSATVAAPELTKVRGLYAFRDRGGVRTDAGAVKLNFPAYGVHLLTSQRTGTDLETLPQLRQRIAKAEAGLERKGNILFGRGREIEFSSSSTYVGNMTLQISLTDGMRDVIGWRHLLGPTPAWVEMAFPAFVPEFRAARIYGNRLGGMTMEIWHNGDWKLVGTAPENPGHEVKFTFDESLRTVKIRLTLPNSQRGHTDAGELYEIELYQ